MKAFWGSLLLLGLVATSVPAQAAFKGCYERIYDKRYLMKHRKQDVVKMRFQIGVGQGTDGPFELLDRVDAGFRKKPLYRGNLVQCTEDGRKLSCDIEGDGGTFTVIDRGRNSLRIDNVSGMRFGDDQDGTEITPKGDHRQFRLFRISTGVCP
jgi:hypothetical protein